MYNYHSSPALTNCIIWANSAGEARNQIWGGTVVNYSCIQGGWLGEGNIDQDPLFVNPGLYWPTEGLVSYWSFDEGAGTIAHDPAGDRWANIYGAQWTTGQVRGALSFDGWPDYVGVEHDPEQNITGDITISA